MDEPQDKISRCRYSFPDFKLGDSGKLEIIHKCVSNDDNRIIKKDDCSNCKSYSCKYIEYPITVTKIEATDYGDSVTHDIGRLVKIRPTEEQYQDKTFIGIYLGKLSLGPTFMHDHRTGVLNIGQMINPAIFVPEINNIIYGAESWWSFITSEEEIKEISNNDINTNWYIEILKKTN